MRGRGQGRRSFGTKVGDHPRVCGEEPYSQSRYNPVWDHPRVCGEEQMSTFFCWTRVGSPPRMRGRVGPHSARKIFAGDHPRAYAGKRPGASELRHKSGDHPRACGEEPYSQSTMLRNLCGITPARAGKSRVTKPPADRRDHPRACGEEWDNGGSICRPDHPRACGEECNPIGRNGRPGITPARAGKSVRPSRGLQL